MSVRQIVITRESKDEYKLAAMGLNDKGMGETLGTDYGTQGEILATLAALLKLLEEPK